MSALFSEEAGYDILVITMWSMGTSVRDFTTSLFCEAVYRCWYVASGVRLLSGGVKVHKKKFQ